MVMDQALHFELRFQLTLRHDGPEPSWRAELTTQPPQPQLRFDSLDELIRYLVRLDLHTPPRGIR